MKNYKTILKYMMVMVAALFITGCVHDDIYDTPDLQGYECKTADFYTNPQNGYTKWTLAELKNVPLSTPITEKAYVEAYVSSTDQSGNIYKTIYVQDAPVNPTHGLTVSVDLVSTYTKFPQGSKVYIEVKDLSVTTYGGVKQLGMQTPAGTRIPENDVPKHIFRDCDVREEIIPVVMTLADMNAQSENLIGALIQINNAEFDATVLCSVYAPEGTTVDRRISDGTATNRVVRNSGYASFAGNLLPSGNGTFVGIYSKFNSTYQMYINKAEDLNMTGFPRLDGIATDPCGIDLNSVTVKSIAEVKQMFTGSLTPITDDFVIKAKVTANDETGNLFKYIYVEDATGGIRINIDKDPMYNDPRFRVGKQIYVKLNGLHIGNVSGELQLGQPFNNNVGRIAAGDVYKFFFDSGEAVSAPVPTERTITQLTAEDVGKWIKIKDVRFVESDLGEPYAVGTTTNRTLTDCAGNQIVLRTSNFASFGANTVDAGQGDVYAILSVFNGTYQLWIPKQTHALLEGPRCDNAVAPVTLFSEEFSSVLNASNWTAVNVTGAQVWVTSNQGSGGSYYAMMNGHSNGTNHANEDWLISREVSLAGYSNINLTFDSDVRYNGDPLKLYITNNYSGDPATTTWTELSANFDTNTGAWGFVNSGNVSLNAFANQTVRIAFKYTSTTAAANTWEIDNVKIKAKP
ncbi:DUF5689 domain-containing protein [Chryseobacterium sp. MFBS3-17]|uniref:DUF5689 domain-containing protein n=1 Tax=Chryseobacterium sp. MFBS3-17 TaxID=2886689 RepID=UPI001D0E6D3F|nr:DUF5689 domain-containing protein [Chryseobacterium sp. MFBS3-17]MCC2590578.1 DUF5689 domain-containing protein [Chryseobacterium sp. MFBS3-17]